MKKFIFPLLVLFLLGCKKEPEIVFSNYPFLFMEEAETSSEGILLQARVLNYVDDMFDSFGFMWEQGQIIANESYEVKLNQLDSDGLFKYKIVTDLVKDKVYFAKPFFKIGDLTVYGNEISFSGIQTDPHSIYGFSPHEGVTNDTITIFGKNFSRKKSRNLVFIGPYPARVVKSTTDEIRVISPQPMTQVGDFSISVRIGTTNVVASDLYSLKSHIVFDFFPKEGFRGEAEIIIYGRGFDGQGGRTVFIGNMWGNTIDWTNDQIRFRINNSTNVGKNPVKVILRNFQETFNDSLLVKSRWQQIDDLPFNFRFEGTLVTNNSYCYLLGGRIYGSNFGDVWRFNPSQGVWTELPPFPGSPRYRAVGVLLGDDIFYGLGRSNADQNSFKDFWKFNIPSQNWQQLGNFPGQENLQANVSLFISNGEIFLTGGDLLEVWKYSPNEDNWTMMGYRQHLPSTSTLSMKFAFNFNGKAFFTFRNSNNHLEIFEFDKNFDGFLKSISSSFGYIGPVFLINDQVYFPSTTTKVYNITTNVWSEIEGIPGYSFNNNIHFYFSLDGKGYSLVRNNIYGVTGFYIFDPTLL